MVSLERRITSFELDLVRVGGDPVQLGAEARLLQEELLLFVSQMELALAA